MKKYIWGLLAGIFIGAAVMAQTPLSGPLLIQKNFSEIATNGTQAAAIANLGLAPISPGTGTGNLLIGATGNTGLSASYNIFGGYRTGVNVTTCTTGLPPGFDVALGYNDLPNDAGCENIAVGGQILGANIGGHNNGGLGEDVLGGVTSGVGIWGFGHGVGGQDGTYAITGAMDLWMLEGACGYCSGAISDTIYIGRYAGAGAPANHNTASGNIGIGSLSLENVSTGTGEVAVGAGTLTGSSSAPLTGTNNTAIGNGAGNAVQGSGNANTMIGDQVFSQLTTGQQNAGLGAFVGFNCITCISDILIGYNTASSILTSGSGNIMICNNCDVPASNTSNWLNIGNAVMAVLSPPTVASGFGTSPSIPKGASTRAFTVNVGSGGSATTGVLNMSQAMPNGYICKATDITHVGSFVTEAVPDGSNPTFEIDLLNYSRTTGLAIAWTANDVITVMCEGY